MGMRKLLLVLGCLSLLQSAAQSAESGTTAAAPPAAIAGAMSEDTSDIVLKAMSDELARSTTLEVPGKPKPYYVRYEVSDGHDRSVTYELGVKTSEVDRMDRRVEADVRIGSYEYDSTFQTEQGKPTTMERLIPVDSDYGAIRKQLWLVTDDAYKQAAQQLETAQAYKRGHDIRHSCDSFSKEPPRSTILPLVTERTYTAEMQERVKKASKIFGEYPEIRSSFIKLDHVFGISRVVNSEGTKSRWSRNHTDIGFVAYARTPDGVDTWDSDYFSADNESDLPSQQELEAKVRKFAENLAKEARAERMDYYYGPILFEPAAATEVVQHGIAPLLCAVRGDNLNPTRTLLRSMNMRILPEFISIIDDPDLKTFQGKVVAGHAPIDSDGIPTQKVTLVDKGFLRNLLSGRTPVYPGQHSNGHNIFDEISQSTLVVTADKTMRHEAMKKKLLDLAKARGLNEAIIVRRIVPNTGVVLNGTVGDARSDALNNRLIEIYAVDVSTGKERRVRGLQFSTFGRANMDSIVAAGDDFEPQITVNWRGYTRSMVAPSLLLENMELVEDAGESWAAHPVEAPKS